MLCCLLVPDVRLVYRVLVLMALVALSESNRGAGMVAGGGGAHRTSRAPRNASPSRQSYMVTTKPAVPSKSGGDGYFQGNSKSYSPNKMLNDIDANNQNKQQQNTIAFRSVTTPATPLFANLTTPVSSKKRPVLATTTTTHGRRHRPRPQTTPLTTPPTPLQQPPFYTNRYAYTKNKTELHQWEVELFRDLFEERGYSNRARPARQHHLPVDVSLQLVVLKINEILEIDQEIVISGFLKINWTDFRLAWRKENYGNIDRVVTEVANIWLPDLALINSDDVYAITRDGRFPITLTSSGSMLYVPAGKISARCELDLRYFPFDSQVCLFRFESWVYNEKAVRVLGLDLTIDKSHFIQNPQWAILQSSTRTTVAEYDNANFSRVDFYILLQRKSLFFLTYTVFPCGIISCLQMFSHILPLAESERVNFGTTTLVAFAVFHISVVEQVPKSSDSIPLLALYVDSLMCLIGVSLVESFLMMNWLTHVGYYTVPEPWLYYILVETLGPYLCLGQAGVHWQRNYLRILLKVRAREENIKKREKHLENLAAESSKGKDGGRAGRARRMSYCSHIYRGFSSRNVSALVKLMERYGDLVADLNTRNKPLLRSISQTYLEDDNNNNNNRGDPDQNDEVFDDDDDDDGNNAVSTESHLGAAQTVVILNNVENSTTPNSDMSSLGLGYMTKKVENDTKTATAVIVENQPAIANANKPSESRRFLSLFGINPLGNHTAATSDKPDQVKERVGGILKRHQTSSNDAIKSNTNTNSRPSPDTNVVKRELQRQLIELRNIGSMLGEIKGGVGHHSLKRECLGIWTVFITAVDRIVSFLIFLGSAFIPVYLFWIYPDNSPEIHEIHDHVEP